MLLSAGMIAYLGAFPAELRVKALASWNKVRTPCAFCVGCDFLVLGHACTGIRG